jgi:hypothetical protein
MIIKGLRDEDFCQYKYAAMFIAFPRCSWKCEKECGERVCQNGTLAYAPDISVNAENLVRRYLGNPITKAICCGGLEPLDSYDDLLELISCVRTYCEDDIVIYTGYRKDEIMDKLETLKQFKNIVVKYGRFVPGQQPHFDKVLQIELASDNQYAEQIS